MPSIPAKGVKDNSNYEDEPHDERNYSDLIIRTQKPFNAEVKLDKLIKSYVTDTKTHFKRNHGAIPTIESDKYQLEVDIGDMGTSGKSRKQIISLEQIKNYPKVKVVAALQCAGNRRDGQAKVKPVNGVIWAAGTISNSQWEGARLRDILVSCGIPADLSNEYYAVPRHLVLEAYGLASDDECYGGSIPLAWAMDPRNDVLVAYNMNGQTMPRDHGYPCRLVVPGVIGARWVKWLRQVSVELEESSNYYQQRDYKILPPQAGKSNCDKYWKLFPALHEFNVQCVICSPQEGSVIAQNKPCTFKGYAVAGGGRPIDRVEISLDGGKTWNMAKLFGISGSSPELYSSLVNRDVCPESNTIPDSPSPVESGQKHWSWKLWTYTIDKVPVVFNNGTVEVISRAWDSSGNTQPMTTTWNYRGVMNNSCFKVSLKATPSSNL
ncbi:hypothetical protein H4219_004651 [Mycoemilia scoparia]|uniref:Sulfite oxidase n=1 Tax=Mycoemilia scoparia TaxID=417184 RepID=A0A9W7ZXJ8_9FUNG|nr:hypothetical protein H4219_004651 [Mycoemilia scoparia]